MLIGGTSMETEGERHDGLIRGERMHAVNGVPAEVRSC